MARPTKRPGDTTGQTALKLAAEHKEELAARQNEISLINAIQDESRLNEIVDLTGGGNATLAQVAALEAELERKNSVTDLTEGEYGTTVQPGEGGHLSPAAGGLTSGTISTALGSDGFQTITHPSGRTERVKTNSTALAGTGPESPFHVPGATVADARLRTIVDTTNPVTGAGIKGLSRDEVSEYGVVEVEVPSVVVRVNSDLPQVTIGAGNLYDFEEGRQYKVPKHVADHLEEKGYVWH
jgi:hypothetical protein